MFQRSFCLAALLGLLLIALHVRAANEEATKPKDSAPGPEPVKGFFAPPVEYTQPNWALTPGGFRPGFTDDKSDSLGSFAYPSSDSTLNYTGAVAATAPSLGVGTEALSTSMIQQTIYWQRMQQYVQYRYLVQQQQALARMTALASGSTTSPTRPGSAPLRVTQTPPHQPMYAPPSGDGGSKVVRASGIALPPPLPPALAKLTDL